MQVIESLETLSIEIRVWNCIRINLKNKQMYMEQSEQFNWSLFECSLFLY